MASLEGKVIAVTGGAYGIGFAVAELLAKRGATIALADVVEDKFTQACDHVKALGVQATAHRVDVQDSQQVEAWMKATNTAFGRLDGAANMAGVSGGKQRPRGIIDQDQNGWDFVLGVNLTGTMNCLRSQLKYMSNGGNIVNASSLMGLQGAPGAGAYTSSKHGVIGLTRCVAQEAGSRDIRVNAIAPGYIDTPMFTSPLGDSVDELSKTVPLGRIGKPEDVAFLVAFLLGDESKYISATKISVDGGVRG